MRNHPKKGEPVKIKTGSLKGHTFLVIDYLETQYQGKPVDKIKTPAVLACLTAVKNRGFPIDSEIVWGKMVPEFNFACVHDSELRIPEGEESKVTKIGKKKKRNVKTVEKEEAHTDDAS